MVCIFFSLASLEENDCSIIRIKISETMLEYVKAWKNKEKNKFK
jgi:hypothetical protein